MHDPDRTSLLSAVELNTALLLNCFEGVDDATSSKRISNQTNNMAFIGCHLTDARFYLANLLGAEAGSSFGGVLDEITSIEEVSTLPKLQEIRQAWVGIGTTLADKIAALTQSELQAPSPQSFPIGDSSLGGAVVFLLQHESFHIGQLALLRKHHGLGAMSWKIDS